MKDVFTLEKAGEKYELDNLIGMKLREGTAPYTEEEIEAASLEVKTPEVLRVLIKWIE